MRLALTILVLVLTATGCDTDALADRTYPEAGDFPAATVPALTVATPGRYNVTAYVHQIHACPPEAICELPDSTVLLEHLADDPPQVGVTVFVDAVRQFRVGDRYIFSIEVFDADGGPPYAVRLLGYDRL